MNFFSYKIEHDYGLAPNPFGEYCTLAVCKPTIRKNRNLKIGDWIFGTGSKKIGKLNHLIFAMKVEGILSFDEYWNDERFQYKKPVLNGSLIQIFGDNFYHLDEEGKQWIQEESAHSTVDKQSHIKNDLSGENVLFSKSFYYFGKNAPKIPKNFHTICNDGRNMKSSSIDPDTADNFLKWLEKSFEFGIHGDPNNWDEYEEHHAQTKLEI